MKKKQIITIVIFLFLCVGGILIYRRKPANEVLWSISANDYTKSSPSYNAMEDFTGVDTFCISDSLLFVDDTVNSCIWVYDQEELNAIIDLPWNKDVYQMYYDIDQKNLQIIYQDRDDSFTHLYQETFSMIKNEWSNPIEIGSLEQSLLSSFFDSIGRLYTLYSNETENEFFSVENPQYLSELTGYDIVGGQIISKNSGETYLYIIQQENGEYKSNILCISNQEKLTFYDPVDSKYGYKAEWFFVSEDGRIYQLVISDLPSNHIQIIILFGSPARGDFHKTSDIDITTFSIDVEEETSILLRYKYHEVE